MATTLLGKSLAQLQQFCEDLNLPSFTARQISDWLYVKRVSNFAQMTNISLANRSILEQVATIGRSAPIQSQTSSDGTKKYLFANSTNRHVESVFIPDADRATLCISCQSGCRMGCRFCATGQQGFHGNLNAADILNQILSVPESQQLTNIVFMGMGEPMDNLDAVLDVCRVLTSSWGLGWSPKRITVSSVGVTPNIQRFLDECQCHLAISLHNPIGTERAEIMPIQKAYPIDQLLALLRKYDWSGQRRLSFEYTLFAELNDDIPHADALATALKGIKCRINLIRYHATPNLPFSAPSMQRIDTFRRRILQHGLKCTLRASRGQDIDAACGMLAGKEQANP